MYACPCRVPRKQREVCSRHGARICSAVMVTAEAPAGTPGICWEKLCNWVSLRVHSIPNTRRCIIQLHTACWLSMAGRGAGWLAEAHKGPKRPREAQRSGAWIEQACPALGWGLPTSRLTTREAPHKQIYDQGARTRTVQNSTEQ